MELPSRRKTERFVDAAKEGGVTEEDAVDKVRLEATDPPGQPLKGPARRRRRRRRALIQKSC